VPESWSWAVEWPLKVARGEITRHELFWIKIIIVF
jgi:hypothetical protein